MQPQVLWQHGPYLLIGGGAHLGVVGTSCGRSFIALVTTGLAHAPTTNVLAHVLQ